MKLKRKKIIIIAAIAILIGAAGIFALNGYFGGGADIPEDTFTRGLVGYWSFDEGSGTKAYDASGNGNNGTLTNGPKWTKGKQSGALSFDGTNDYVNAGSGASLDITSAITIEAWIYALSFPVGGYRGIVHKGDVDNGYHLMFEGNKAAFYFRSSTLGWTYVTGTTILSTNKWYHLVVTYNGVNVIHYVNGESETPVSKTGTIQNSNLGSLLIGEDYWTDKYHNGTIDEVRIYNRALSAEEVRYHYNRGSPSAHWKFDEGSGSTAYDATENNNDGTLYPNIAFQSYNSGDDASVQVYEVNWYAQTFTPSVNQQITSVKLKLFRVGSNPQFLDVGIRATSGGLPTGSDLTSGSIIANNFTTDTNGSWYEIRLTPYNLTANTKYAIVVRVISGTGSSYAGWRYDGSSPTYTGGAYISSSDSGSSWTENTGRDFMFETWSSPPQWTTGKYNLALNFDGTDDYVSSNSNLTSVSAFSHSLWFKSADGSFSANEYLFTQGINDPSVYLGTDGKINVMADNSLKITSTKTFLDTNWHYLEITADGSTIKLYLDGILESSASYTGSSVTGILYVAANATPGSYFGGIIDDVRVYNYARTADEIRLDYNAGLAAHFGPSAKTCSEDPASCMDYGLVGYWSMDEGVGQTAYDSSAFGNNGTLGADASAGTDDPRWTKGKQGGALSFNKNHYVKIDDSTNLNTGLTTTFEFWIKGSPPTGYLYNRGTASSNNDFHNIVISTKIAWYYSYFNPPSSQGYTWQFSNDITWATDTWSHIIIISNVSPLAGGSTVAFYVNGINYGNFSLSYYVREVVNGTAYIGRYGGSESSKFRGEIDEVRIYNRALSAEEIRYHYNRSNPVLQYKFDEGSGTKAYDSSGNADADFPSATSNQPTWSVP